MIRNQLKDADKEVLLQRAYLYDFIKVRVKSKNKSLIAYARHDTMEKVLTSNSTSLSVLLSIKTAKLEKYLIYGWFVAVRILIWIKSISRLSILLGK